MKKRLITTLLTLSICLTHITFAKNNSYLKKTNLEIDNCTAVDWVMLTALVTTFRLTFDGSNVPRSLVNDYNLSVYNLEGDLVFDKTQNNKNFNLEHLPRGTYFIHLKFNSVSVLSKRLNF